MRALLTLVAGVTALLLTGCATGTRPASAGGQHATGSQTPTGQAAQLRQTAGSPTGSTPSSTAAGAAPTATDRVVIRPVTASGRPAPGFTAVSETQGTADCAGPIGFASPAAVDGGIVECSPAYLDAVACWRTSAARSVLCYRDPWSKRLTLLHTDGPVAVPAATRAPSPFGLLLADGTRCWLRIGGAWSRLDGHPELYGSYGCQHEIAVWGPANSDGIDRSAPTWTVRVAPMSGHGTLRTVAVRAAYYVGTRVG